MDESFDLSNAFLLGDVHLLLAQAAQFQFGCILGVIAFEKRQLRSDQLAC